VLSTNGVVCMQKKKKKKTQTLNLSQKFQMDPILKCKSKKPLEDNIGENLGDLGFDHKFLDVPPKARSMKEGM